MSIFWSIVDAWPSTVLCEHFNFLLSSELPYPSCQNCFHSPGGSFRMEAGHRGKCIVSLNPSGFKILLTSMPVPAWHHQSTRSSPLFSGFLLSTIPLYQNALRKTKRQGLQSVIIYPDLEAVGMNGRTVKFFPVTWGSISVSHLLPPHPFSSINPPWNPCFSNRTPIGDSCLRKKRRMKISEKSIFVFINFVVTKEDEQLHWSFPT